MRRTLTWLLPLFLLGGLGEAAATCRDNRVFADHNGNGRQDAGEPGIAGAKVYDGQRLQHTDASGRYRVADGGGEAFLIKPPGFALPARSDGLPGHWRTAGTRCQPFALRPQPGAGALEVWVLADPQTKRAAQVEYYRRDIITPLREAPRARLGLTLGDVVDDDLSLYPSMIAATASLGVPWLHLPGNHDLDMAAGDAQSLATFRRHFGPDTFAWEEAEASFILLDNVIWQPGQRPAYVGGLRPAQFAFLEDYLRSARRERLLVLAMHIPLFEADGRDTFRDADRARLFALLEPFPRVLVLSGHTHTQQHVRHPRAGGEAIHEYNVGAASGAFWSGVKDAEGVPVATMADGTPNGHARLRVEADGRYRLSYHPARGKAHPHIGLHLPKRLRQGAYPAWGVYANVWMGMDDTRVEYRINGGEWQPMRKVLQPDPALLGENARDDEADALRGYDRSPEARPSAHLWRGTLPTHLPAGAHAVEVRAFDHWQGEVRASGQYHLDIARDTD